MPDGKVGRMGFLMDRGKWEDVMIDRRKCWHGGRVGTFNKIWFPIYPITLRGVGPK